MSKILDGINEPADLKGLSVSELKQLASEIREELLSTVTANGGHLASNLGVVELTIALHRAFDSPRDKLVWDVGHQTYVHKLLTGRKDSFSSIRQHGGLSGFTDRSESPHDVFGAGHASTSVSAAMGMAVARDLSGEDYHVVAIIGDGSLTGGMALEALNQAGHQGTNFIVVLNDNGMAISPSVGALARLFNRVRRDKRYHRAKGRAERFVTGLPLGSYLWGIGRRIKDAVKGIVMPSTVWEKLGFFYIGPIDGHDIAQMEAAFLQAKDYPAKPIFVHVVTTKGKGYRPAEADAVGFHGVPPNGGQLKVAPSYSEVFGQTLLAITREDPRVVAVTAAMSEGTGLSILANEFPRRVFDVGICEQHAVTFAAGLATRGFIPVVAIYSTFLQRAFDQVIHDICIQNLHVIFAVDRAGIVGEDGKTHQGSFDLSYLGCIPNMVVAVPKDEDEIRHLLYTAVRADCPMAIRYPRGAGLGMPLSSQLHQLPLGEGEVLKTGNDVAILAVGTMVAPAMEAAQRLSQNGIESTVINARFVKPLDSQLILDAATMTHRVVTVEENVLLGGFGSAVLQLLQNSALHGIKTKCIGLPDVFVEHGAQPLLRSKYYLDARGIAEKILASFPELAACYNLSAHGASR